MWMEKGCMRRRRRERRNEEEVEEILDPESDTCIHRKEKKLGG